VIRTGLVHESSRICRAFSKSGDTVSQQDSQGSDQYPLGPASQRLSVLPLAAATSRQVQSGGSEQAHQLPTPVGLQHLPVFPKAIILHMEQPVLNTPMPPH
jgi:hypothetical protein